MELQDLLEKYNGSIPLHEMEGLDVTELLGIQKWEKAIPANLRGTVLGNFPSFIHKTDEERVQNLTKELRIWTRTDLNEYEIAKHGNDPLTWEVTEKLDGSSMTVYLNDGVFGVCSRNLDLKEDEANAFWKAARAADVENKMRDYATPVDGLGDCAWALQGELIGPGVQGNLYNLKELEFRIFNLFNITEQAKAKPEVRRYVVDKLGLLHAPLLHDAMILTPFVNAGSLLELADSKSLVRPEFGREGIVFKCNEHPEYHFKAISNAWLLKHE